MHISSARAYRVVSAQPEDNDNIYFHTNISCAWRRRLFSFPSLIVVLLLCVGAGGKFHPPHRTTPVYLAHMASFAGNISPPALSPRLRPPPSFTGRVLSPTRFWPIFKFKTCEVDGRPTRVLESRKWYKPPRPLASTPLVPSNGDTAGLPVRAPFPLPPDEP